MRIYQHEKNDGIDFQMNKAGSSSAFVTAQVQVRDIAEYCNMTVAELMESTSTVSTVEELLGQEHPDLALVVAILVSTGWNRNDDIFTPEEVWRAKSSPLHKPMNDNHDAEKILGHIVQSRAIDKSGKEIELSEGDEIPTEFDIEVAGVLYRQFPELHDRINEIITKAHAGEIFVSMEAWFPDFGYGFIDTATGETKLIERTESTAFLTKHLRVYGGCGEYQGYKVGRVLKDIIFGAQGFVDKPANPESVIKVAANEMAASRDFAMAELSELVEGGVDDVDEKEKKELQAKLEEAQANLRDKQSEVVELVKAAEELAAKDCDGQIATLTENVETLTASVTEVSAKVTAVEAEKVELQKQLDKATSRADKVEAELGVIRKTETARERMLKLTEVKKVEDEKATLAELVDMTDETFELVLKYAGEAKSDESGQETVDAGEQDEDKARSVLDNVEENTSADFNASENAQASETQRWNSMASDLCGRTEKKDEGGE